MNQLAARLVVHQAGEPSRVYLFEDERPRFIGRLPGSDITIDHPSISREHAELVVEATGWVLRDLNSKNGIKIEGERVSRCALTGHCWIAIGDVFCEFEPIRTSEIERQRFLERTRRHTSAAWHARISVSQNVEALLSDVLQGMISLAECQRGCLLMGDAFAGLKVVVTHTPADDGGRKSVIEWSRSAVERCLRERRSVFLSPHADHAWLRAAASVVAQGLRALACIPLLSQDRLIGVAYVDTDLAARVFTQLDVELLEAFADQAALSLAFARIDSDIHAIEVQDIGSSSTTIRAPS